MHDTDTTPFTAESFVGIPACPGWCDLEDRHSSYDQSTDHTYAACSHERNMGAYTYIITEDVAVLGEPVRRRVPWIAISVSEHLPFDAEEVRKIAAELLVSADKLDEITAATA
jgi:hypothetical protein